MFNPPTKISVLSMQTPFGHLDKASDHTLTNQCSLQ